MREAGIEIIDEFGQEGIAIGVTALKCGQDAHR